MSLSSDPKDVPHQWESNSSTLSNSSLNGGSNISFLNKTRKYGETDSNVKASNDKISLFNCDISFGELEG